MYIFKFFEFINSLDCQPNPQIVEAGGIMAKSFAPVNIKGFG
jgi:hypothetical protein